MRRIIILFLITAAGFYSHAQSNTLFGIKNSGQTFRFIGINCVNDSITDFALLPTNFYDSYFSSCYDFQNQLYYLCTGETLFTLNAVTGNLVDTFTFNITPAEHLTHIVFNQKDRLIYGLTINLINFDQNLSAINPVTHALDTSRSVNPHVRFGIGCKSIIDQDAQKYILQSSDLATIDIATGTVLSVRALNNLPDEVFDHVSYSCRLQRTFGLSNDPHVPQEYFASADSVSATVSHVSASPLQVYYYKQYLSGSAIDNSTDIFYFPAAYGKLYGVNVQTGNIVYSHDYGPAFEILFLESSSDYHCLIQDAEELVSQQTFSVYPNPANAKLFITGNITDDISEVDIYNSTGQKQHTDHPAINNNYELNIANLSPGIYFLRLKTAKEILVRRFVKE